MALGRKAAPHLQRHGTKAITHLTGQTEKEASSNVSLCSCRVVLGYSRELFSVMFVIVSDVQSSVVEGIYQHTKGKSQGGEGKLPEACEGGNPP